MSVPAEELGTLAHHPEEARLVALVAPESVAAEQYRILLARLDRISATRPLRLVAFSSCAPGEGRTTTAVNLALTAARDGREVALVEADLKRPSVARLFDLVPAAGLAEVAAGKAELAQAISRVGNLAVVCAGAAHGATTVLRSPRLAAAMETLRSSFRLVVLDGPPAFAFSGAGQIAACVDGIVLVVLAGATPRDVVQMAVESLSDRLLGIVLNGVEQPAHAERYLTDAVGTL
ncbi:MAG TPA: CpsD/CapB family tyrosine-protein kinase [Anaeromyxobacteraceae bacterium]|nr:CpsD/CapB family tyrosine-protein kinase [Anaeromyxobacteraceae bacterium]